MRQVLLYQCVHVFTCVHTCNWCCGGGVHGAVFVVILRSLKLYAKPHKRTSLNGPSPPRLLPRPWTSLNVLCLAGRGVRLVLLAHNHLFFNYSKALSFEALSSPAPLSLGPCDVCVDPDSWQAPAMVFVWLVDSPSHRVDVTLSRRAKVPFGPQCNSLLL